MTLESAKLKLNAYDLNYQIYGTNIEDDNYITVHVPDDDNNENLFSFQVKSDYMTVRDFLAEIEKYPNNSVLRYINAKLQTEIIDTKLERYPEISDFEIERIAEDTLMVMPKPEYVKPFFDILEWNYQGMRLR